MGKRYYCDYCDKSMIADAGTIERHQQSAQHHVFGTLIGMPYVQVGLDPSRAIVNSRPICHAFVNTGYYTSKPQRSHYRIPKDMPKNLPPSLRPPPPTGYDLRYAGSWD
ncbi:hypothetical protein BDF22DRAFT_699080 [Syncephalis plumigaleata]|nr:hypothetical protein BDF22DRAFT_699080 [Syncephalis plumigaleata]